MSCKGACRPAWPCQHNPSSTTQKETICKNTGLEVARPPGRLPARHEALIATVAEDTCGYGLTELACAVTVNARLQTASLAAQPHAWRQAYIRFR